MHLNCLHYQLIEKVLLYFSSIIITTWKATLKALGVEPWSLGWKLKCYIYNIFCFLQSGIGKNHTTLYLTAQCSLEYPLSISVEHTHVFINYALLIYCPQNRVNSSRSCFAIPIRGLVWARSMLISFSPLTSLHVDLILFALLPQLYHIPQI